MVVAVMMRNKRSDTWRIRASLLIMALMIVGWWQPVSSQTVEIRRTFFRGWRYSVDSAEFRKLGSRAEPLRAVMKDYRVCISALNSYQSHVTAAKVTGLTSVLLIGWPVSAKLRGKEWIDGYTPMVVVGGTLAISSLALEAAGSRQLKKAIRFYNKYRGYPGQAWIEPVVLPSRRLGAGIVVGWRF